MKIRDENGDIGTDITEAKEIKLRIDKPLKLYSSKLEI